MKKAAFLCSRWGISKRRLCGSLFCFVRDNVLHDFAKVCRKGKNEVFQNGGVCVHRLGFLGKGQAHKPVQHFDNLKELFPVCRGVHGNEYVRRLEAAYRRRTYYHKAHYSLDRGDGIEYDALFVSMTPCELYERKVTMEQLHAAIAALPDKQAKRIYAYYFLGLTESAIAKSEGVSVASVSESIQRGLRNMETFLKNRL